MNITYVGTLCAALVVGGALIAGSTTAADTVDVKTPAMGQSNQNPWLIKDNAYFDRYIDKAVKHAAEAELAGMLGHGPELLEHTQESLDQSKEAQRAGNVQGLNEGIAELREALNTTRAGDGSIAACTSRTDANGTVIYDDPTCPTRNRQPQGALQSATAHVRQARINLSKAGGIKPVEIRTTR